VVQFGLRIRPAKQEIPSTALRAGSSLRLKNGYAQDDTVVERTNCATARKQGGMDEIRLFGILR
jgi:hypothetical protein